MPPSNFICSIKVMSLILNITHLRSVVTDLISAGVWHHYKTLLLYLKILSALSLQQTSDSAPVWHLDVVVYADDDVICVQLIPCLRIMYYVMQPMSTHLQLFYRTYKDFPKIFLVLWKEVYNEHSAQWQVRNPVTVCTAQRWHPPHDETKL